MKLALISENQSSFKRAIAIIFIILQLLDIWQCQSFVILFFSSAVILILDESDGACLV